MSGNLQKETDSFVLNSIDEAIADIKAGKVIIVVDDEDRENEGDFICAADCVTPEIINFMAKNGCGLICTPIEEHRAKQLKLDKMVSSNTALHETAFTISIDLIGRGCTTGISAYDRATGIKAIVDPNTKAEDFARPGHIFPLIAKAGGVLRRTGHTEAAIDLARLAGFFPAGVLVEILDDDGSAARLPKLMKVAKKFDLKIIAIKDLITYRMKTERLVHEEFKAPLETKYGTFEMLAYRQLTTGDVHIALKKGNWLPNESILTRVHSAQGTGEIIDSLLKGNSHPLQKSLEMIQKEGKGIVLFMRHGENKDALLNKLKALTKQGHPETTTKITEQRDFGVGAQILHDLQVTKLRLLMVNPKRRVALTGYGLEIVERIQL